MIELVLVVCLIDQPGHCRDVGVTYLAENITPMQCIMQAPPHMARWAGEHPGWRIARWTCRRPGRTAKT